METVIFSREKQVERVERTVYRAKGQAG